MITFKVAEIKMVVIQIFSIASKRGIRGFYPNLKTFGNLFDADGLRQK